MSDSPEIESNEKRRFTLLDLDCMICDAINIFMGELPPKLQEFSSTDEYRSTRRTAVQTALAIWWKEKPDSDSTSTETEGR